MEVFLYNSTICRLCGEENDNGTLLYTHEENNQTLSEIINTYLPIKVSDDGHLPRSICPGCTIQLEATVEFFNLIIKGQKIIRELLQRENDYKKNVLNCESEVITEKIVYEINTGDGVYQVEHPVSLQMQGLDKPKRKRGRPSKKSKTPEELSLEAAAAAAAKAKEARSKAENKVQEDESNGKRRRKTPNRFREAVQGKELEKIFLETGVIDKEEKEAEVKKEYQVQHKVVTKEPEVIGHVAASGEPVIIVKGKGRGRPKGGRRRPDPWRCQSCGMEFWSEGRYMSHLAIHHPNVPHDNNTCLENIEIDSEQAETPQPIDEPNERRRESEKTIVETNDTTTPIMANNNTDKTCDPVSGDSDPLEPDGEETVEASGKKKLKCKYCDKLFSTRQSKSLHIKAVHFGERPHVCTECGATFPYPRSLALHMVTHRRRRSRRGYACDLCGKILNHPSSVIYHKQSVHAAQRFVCGACGKHFRHCQLLRRHQLVHSAERPFRCKECNSSFKTKANLYNHQLLHSGVKKFSCEVCRQKFSHKTSLTLHMRWHTGVKPFTCESCGKTFSQKGNLSEHERIHTGEKPFACAHCPRKFTTSSQHRLHARRHHVQHNRRLPAAESPAPVPSPASECSLDRIELLLDSQDLHKHKNNKQMSLLVNEQMQPSALKVTLTSEQLRQLCAQPEEQDGDGEGDGDGGGDGDGDEVIYVAYDIENEDSPTFQIIDARQAVGVDEEKVESTCELYPGAPLVHYPALQREVHVQVPPPQVHIQQIVQQQHVEVIGHQERRGAQGARAPLQFRMQDGTLLAVTSRDGETLQIVTQDGQTIPVEVNTIDGDVVETVTSDSMDSLAGGEECKSDGGGGGGGGGAGARYFTIV